MVSIKNTILILCALAVLISPALTAPATQQQAKPANTQPVPPAQPPAGQTQPVEPVKPKVVEATTGEPHATNPSSFKTTAETAKKVVENAAEKVTEKAKEAANAASEKVKQAASAASETVQQAASSATEKVQQAAKDAANTASEKVKQAANSASETAQQAAGTASEKVKQAANTASEKAQQTASAASGKAKQATNAAAEKAQQTAGAASGKARQAANTASEKVKRTAKDAANTASEKAKQAANAAQEEGFTVENAQKLAGEYAQRAQEVASDVLETSRQQFDTYSKIAVEQAQLALENSEVYTKLAAEHAEGFVNKYFAPKQATYIKENFINIYGLLGGLLAILTSVYFVKKIRWYFNLNLLRAFFYATSFGASLTLFVLAQLSADPAPLVAKNAPANYETLQTGFFVFSVFLAVLNSFAVLRGGFSNFVQLLVGGLLFVDYFGVRPQIEEHTGPLPAYGFSVFIFYVLTFLSFAQIERATRPKPVVLEMKHVMPKHVEAPIVVETTTTPSKKGRKANN